MESVLTCPLPLPARTHVTVGHGGGGKLTQDLIDRIFRPAFANSELDAQTDAAVLPPSGSARLAFTTDAHVVSPLFFPGGDIGCLAVNGTVNDLAMVGARPLWLSASFILEEGLDLAVLERIARSMGAAAERARVRIVAGDTKVVERGRCDGVYISTAGVGRIEHKLSIGPASLRDGDSILVSGDVGRHGMAIMACREGLEFENPIESDCAPLGSAVASLLAAGVTVRCLRDLTRGGLATCLVELAQSGKIGIAVDESAVPVSDAVRGACEILGLEPMFVANEGRFLCVVPPEDEAVALSILAWAAPGGPPARIGTVTARHAGQARLRSLIGAERILDRLSGEQLPRIC